jgi:hypothetical protein
MDDIQCPASLPRRHRVAFDDPLHADDEIRVATIQQIDPLMTVRDQPAQLLVLGITFARDEMVGSTVPTPAVAVTRSGPLPATER